MLESNLASFPIEANLKHEKNGDEDKVDVTLLKKIVGSLKYQCYNMGDIEFSVGLVSRYMDDPRVSHMKDARRILRYINGTTIHDILFPISTNDNDVMIMCYLSSNWYGYKYDRRSTIAYFFKVFDALKSWGSRNQPVVALSSGELEYIA
ncbi:uncharacterized mitochondrial protein AtMg00810-like [Lathyrus oleraceus]|uniref:uncharacterized mitochondrial protein AtMg00810-like n=1 Tax=Pisum sativum TaxID=3888 RepID=UPI0021D31A2B|nr:uncharacterized mitochondrial protein AtMg00810-like [Pisum sativum]